MQVKSYVSRLIDPRKIRRKSIETIRKLTSRGMAVTVNAERKADSIFTFTYAFLETRVHICMS